MDNINVTDLADDAVILDVREQDEWDAGHAPNAVHIPMSELPSRTGDLPEDEPLPVVCRAGGRSLRSAAWLEGQGYNVINVDGGMQAWQAAGKQIVADNGEATIV